MEAIKVNLRRWGGSLGTTIPKDIIQRDHLVPNSQILLYYAGPKKHDLSPLFGILKAKRPTKELMDELDKEERRALERHHD